MLLSSLGLGLPARADEPTAPGSATPAAVAPPAASPRGGTERRARAGSAIDPALENAPSEPPSVPTPSPVVLGGKPTPEDRVGVPLGWNGSRFSTADYVITGAAGATTLATAIASPLKTHAIQGPILFDNAVRNALRSNNIQTRYAFRDASDVGLSLAATYPFFVDALATAWWYHGSRDVAQEMALLDLETLAIAGAVQGVTNVLVSRERPYGQYCGVTGGLPAAAGDCTGTQEYRSFFSGHSTFTFTSAALVCLAHTRSDLLGSPWDALSCASAYVVASGTATLRVLADEHYATDVLTGALVGTLLGYGVPYLHFHGHDLGKLSGGGMTLQLIPAVGGAGVLGTF